MESSDEELASKQTRTSFLEALVETTRSPSEGSHDGSSARQVQPSISLHDKLPVELLPLILRHFRYRQAELARTCLVCRAWAEASRPLLWEWVRAPRDVERIEQAFSALSRNPTQLGPLVRELELRVSPLASEKAEVLQLDAVNAFKHATNLCKLTWTRKGSLDEKVFDAICALPNLEELELNAAPAGEWRADQLLGLPKTLKSLVLLLPEREIVASMLPKWLASLKDRDSATLLSSRGHLDSEPTYGLSNLSIVCLNSTMVNGPILRDIAANLDTVTSLTLHGCTKLADEDVLYAIKRCGKLRHLSLENVSISPDFYALAAPHLESLESLRTSHPGRRSAQSETYYDGLCTLVQRCRRFEAFTHYLSGDTERGIHPQVPKSFFDALLDSHATHLRKFEVNGLSFSLDSIRDLCFRANGLQQLVIPIANDDVDDLQFFLLRLKHLISLHLVSASSTALRITLHGMLDFVKHSPETLRHVGVQNRVRSIRREVARGHNDLVAYEDDGDPTRPAFVRDGIRVSLQLWDEPIGVWPEALQVIRT